MLREILARVSDYVTGVSSLEEFEDWFIPATWGINGTQDAGAAAAANQISLRLAEFLNGDWSELELKDQLSILLRPDLHFVRLEIAGWRITWGSSGATGDSRILPLIAA